MVLAQTYMILLSSFEGHGTFCGWFEKDPVFLIDDKICRIRMQPGSKIEDHVIPVNSCRFPSPSDFKS